MPAASAAAAAHVVEDCHGILRVLSDGTILRSSDPVFCPSVFPDHHPSVQWKERVYDKANDLRVRMYKPSAATGESNKLPVLVYFHGGGFCLGSCTWGNVHSFCLRLAVEAGAIVLSAGYRLAPEHRLPAAVDDAARFILWLREQAVNVAADRWLAGPADFGRVFISGDSAGGGIAHHFAVLVGSPAKLAEIAPVTIRGYVLLMPFFGGINRTPSEAGCPAETFLNLEVYDRFWRLSLPGGATRDHPMANPFGPDSPGLGPVDFRRVLVVTAGRDMLRDRALDYVARLEAAGKPVELAEFVEEHHGFFGFHPWSESSGELVSVVRRFLES